jgi:hypothetical protein
MFVASRYCTVLALAAAVASLLLGCSSKPEPAFVAKPEPWRHDEERTCLASGRVRESRFLQGRSSLGGSSACGAARPFEMAGTSNGLVGLRPTAILRCPMIPAVEHWVETVVAPAARLHLGMPVIELKVAASYACRPINHQSGARLSEHGLANALDISEFHLADGRKVTVKDGWWGGVRERGFLRAVHRGACNTFSTVLGPDADRFHRDHFHMDLARHGRDGTYRVCR